MSPICHPDVIFQTRPNCVIMYPVKVFESISHMAGAFLLTNQTNEQEKTNMNKTKTEQFTASARHRHIRCFSSWATHNFHMSCAKMTMYLS